MVSPGRQFFQIRASRRDHHAGRCRAFQHHQQADQVSVMAVPAVRRISILKRTGAGDASRQTQNGSGPDCLA
jgi:hypothetical protein